MAIGARTQEFAHDVVVKDDGDYHGYEPIDYLCFDEVLNYFQPIAAADGFLDYGCGMGRERVRQLRRLNAGTIEIIEQDATSFEIPKNVNHIFLFDSFTGDVLQATLEQIRSSLARYPRRLKLVYVQPLTDEDPLTKISWLRHDRDLSTGYWMHVRSRAYTNVTHQPGNAVC